MARAVDKAALSRQMRTDARVQDLVRKRTRGSIPGVVTAAELRQFGYDVPEDWHYRGADARNPAHLYDSHDKWDTIIPAAGATMLGLGVGGVAGIGPLAGTPTASAADVAALSAHGSVGSAPAYVPVAGAAASEGAAAGLGSTLARYGLAYGLPIAGQLISSGMQARGDREATALMMDYYNRALAAEREELEYQRRFNEDERGYDRAKYAESTNAGRRNYGNYVQTLEPFRAAGTAANQYAARLLGHNVPDYTGGTYYDLAREASRPVDLEGYNARPSSASAPSPAEAPPVASTRPEPMTSTGGTVLMRAPTGQVKPVEASQVAYYEQLGARRV